MTRILTLLLFLGSASMVSAQFYWIPVGGKLGFSEDTINHPALIVNKFKNPIIAYNDFNVKQGGITTKIYSTNNWTKLEVLVSKGPALFTQMKERTDGNPVMLFIDQGDSNRLVVKKLIGSKFIQQGVTGDFPTYSSYPNLDLSKDDSIFVSYIDSGMVVAKQFSNDKWKTLGKGRINYQDCNAAAIAVSPTGVPYVVYKNGDSTSMSLSVKKLNASGEWEFVGDSLITTDNCRNPLIDFDQKGNVYVAYRAMNDGGKAFVRKLKGSTWEVMGAGSVSKGRSRRINFIITDDNRFFVSYLDLTTNQQPTVKHWDGNGWDSYGKEGFSNARCFFPTLAVDKTGFPYMMIQDVFVQKKLSVLMPDGVKSVNEVSSSSIEMFPNPAIGKLYFNSVENQKVERVQIVNMTGQIVLDQSVSDVQQIDISKVEVGIYQVIIHSGPSIFRNGLVISR